MVGVGPCAAAGSVVSGTLTPVAVASWSSRSSAGVALAPISCVAVTEGATRPRIAAPGEVESTAGDARAVSGSGVALVPVGS